MGGFLQCREPAPRQGDQRAGGQCVLDMRVRAGGSHHQKFVVLRHPGRPERDIAFVGGIDLGHSRRDDDEHLGDPQPQSMASVYGPRPPWHDLQVAITGPAVGDVETVFRERWEDPGAQAAPRCAGLPTCSAMTTSGPPRSRRSCRPAPDRIIRRPSCSARIPAAWAAIRSLLSASAAWLAATPRPWAWPATSSMSRTSTCGPTRSRRSSRAPCAPTRACAWSPCCPTFPTRTAVSRCRPASSLARASSTD